MDVMKLLEELDEELNNHRGLFTKKVDVDKCADLVRKIRKTLPETLREAEYVVANRDKILDNADSVAKNTIREAEDRAEHIVDNSEIIRRAEMDAKRIIDSAYAQCDALTRHTKDHLDNTFKEVEQFLLSTLTMIRNNREELRAAMIVSGKND